MGWYWEKRGDNEFTPPQIGTIFQGWEAPRAGLFSENEIPVQTEVFVRELVQNFVDASREEFSPGTKPKLTLRFLELSGKDAKRVVDCLGLDEIPDHYEKLDEGARNQLRIPDSEVLRGELETIRLLVAEESGTSGMFGQWERSSEVKDSSGRTIRNKMRDAMLSSVRDASAGKGLGSFGEGKKAVIAVSRPRTLFAYTCFQPESSADGVYSRFLGALYWENHNLENTKYSGLALLGHDTEGSFRPEPFVDSEADDLAASLVLPGFESRKTPDGLKTGTSLLFVDPQAAPQEIADALARNWWPILLEGLVEFEVFDENGVKIEITIPDELKPFVDAYEAEESNEVEDWESATGPAFLCRDLITHKLGPSGKLSLAIDLRPGVGFSRSNPEKNWSLVALIRDGMIIKYQQAPSKSQSDNAPFVRGVLVVNSKEHAASESALRKIEPPLHNNWPVQREGMDSETVKHSVEIWSLLKKNVEDFKREYSSNIPDSDQDLPLFRELLGITGGSAVQPGPGPTPTTSPVSLLNNKATIEEGSREGMRIARAKRNIALRKGLDFDSLAVEIEIGWEVDEGGKWQDATDQLLASITEVAEGFEAKDSRPNVFVGELGANEISFGWTTRDYRDLWTLRPYMRVTAAEEVD